MHSLNGGQTVLTQIFDGILLWSKVATILGREKCLLRSQFMLQEFEKLKGGQDNLCVIGNKEIEVGEVKRDELSI